MFFQLVPMNGAAIKAGRCSGFKPANAKTRFAQLLRNTMGWWFANTARRNLFFTDMDETSEKGTRCQDNSSSADILAALSGDTHNVALLNDETTHRSFNNTQVFLR